MNKKILTLKTSTFLFFLLLWGSILNAQLPDGTTATPEYINELLKNLPQENALNFDTSSVDLSVRLTIAVYIVRDSNGNLNVDPNSISQILKMANNYFKPIGIRFNVSSITNVDDYHYSYFSIEKRPEELLKKHSTQKTINLYLVDYIEKDSVPYYGFTYFPVDTLNNFIFLRKDFFTENYLSCMLGHFLGLLSTHERAGGVELVNESNCSATGDYICDTYADPNILNLVNDKCLYFGMSTDPAFSYYIPSVANIMSNSPGNCRCLFTKQQYRRMYFYYKKFRQYLR